MCLDKAGWYLVIPDILVINVAVKMAVEMAVKRENLDLESFEELEIVCG